MVPNATEPLEPPDDIVGFCQWKMRTYCHIHVFKPRIILIDHDFWVFHLKPTVHSSRFYRGCMQLFFQVVFITGKKTPLSYWYTSHNRRIGEPRSALISRGFIIKKLEIQTSWFRRKLQPAARSESNWQGELAKQLKIILRTEEAESQSSAY